MLELVRKFKSDGKIRMSASLMDGESQKMSGVINIEEVKNPIQVAQVLMQVDDRVLGGSGATNFARKHGFEPFSTEIPQRRAEYEAKLAIIRNRNRGLCSFRQKWKNSSSHINGWKRI
jgi:L-asparaginase